MLCSSKQFLSSVGKQVKNYALKKPEYLEKCRNFKQSQEVSS